MPIPDNSSEPFWAAARAGVLSVQACTTCGALQHPPSPVCRKCTSDDLDFQVVSGRGTLYTFTVSMQPFVPGFEESTPLAIGLVALDEDASVRVLSNIVDTELEMLEVGMPVEVTFENRDDGTSLPQFRGVVVVASS